LTRGHLYQRSDHDGVRRDMVGTDDHVQRSALPVHVTLRSAVRRAYSPLAISPFSVTTQSSTIWADHSMLDFLQSLSSTISPKRWHQSQTAFNLLSMSVPRFLKRSDTFTAMVKRP